MVHAPSGINARTDLKSNRPCIELLAFEPRNAEQFFESKAARFVQHTQPKRFKHTILAKDRHDVSNGSDCYEIKQPLLVTFSDTETALAGLDDQRTSELVGNACAAKFFVFVCFAWDKRVQQNRFAWKRRWHLMMIAHDRINPEFL